MRTDGDSWDITSGVGSTALFVAVARALAARMPDPPAVDPFAEVFVRAAGPEWAALLDGAVPGHPLTEPGFGAVFQQYLVARTRYFDDFCVAAADGGVRQVVILAAGLDARAYRLPWPGGATVYELDRAPVLEFKAKALAAVGATPRARRREVPVDLREDWPRSLRDSGFDPSRPAAWLAEGLMAYLPATAGDRLFESVDALSAPGSSVAVEEIGVLSAEDIADLRTTSEASEAGGTDWLRLIYNEPRDEAAAWFTAHGWTASHVPIGEYTRRHIPHALAADPATALVTSLIGLVTAVRP
jgi:methyltransferase (TIGR00027 family)